MKTVATMSIDGLDSIKSTMMVKAFEWYQVAQKSQSSIYEIRSLDYTLSLHNPGAGLAQAIKDDLEHIYKDMFDRCEVLINTKEDEKTGTVIIGINVIGYDEDKRYSLNRELETRDSKLVKYRTVLKDKMNIK